jgi:hypothetical protein
MSRYSKYAVRRWVPGGGVDPATLLQAAAASHAAPPKQERWFRWKYLENPLGPAVIVVATKGDRVAGMLAFGRTTLRAPSGFLTGAQSLETFVVPEDRRRGVFQEMLAAAHRELTSEGIDVAFNFPNQASLPGFLAAGWDELHRPRTWARPASVQALRGLPRLRLRPTFFTHRGTLVQQPAADIFPTASRSLLTHGNSVHRHDTRSSLTWRLTPHQSAYGYHLVESHLAVVRSGTRADLRELQLLDVWAAAPKASPGGSGEVLSPSTTRALVHSLKAAHPFQLATIVAPSSGYNTRSLLANGFVPIPNSIRPCARGFSHAGEKATDHSWAFTALDFHTY